MKFLRILFLVFLASCGPVYAQIQLGTNFQVNTALPIDSRMSVADLTARDAISALVRWEGLITYVVSVGKHYALIGGIDNLDWQELGTGGGGGGGLDKWATATEYTADVSVIWEPLSLKIYVANTTHTSGATFAGDIANWDELSNPFSATNLSVTGNSLISTDINGPVIIAPNGTGVVQIGGSGTITTNGTGQNLTLDANGAGIIDVNAPINLESVTANQVAFSDTTTGNIIGDADFVYDSATNSLTASELNFLDSTISSTVTNQDITLSPDGVGEVDVSSPLNVENVRVAGNTISAIDTDGSLWIDSNGVGEVNINGVRVDGTIPVISPNTTDTALQLSGNGTGAIQLNSVTEVENFILDGDEIQAAATNSDIDFVPNGTGDVNVTYGTNKLSLNPTSGKDSLLKNPSFETGEVEYSCTNATGAIVASTIPSQNDARMFQMTVTAAGGFCDFTATTGAKFEGLPFVIGGLFQTQLLDVEYCSLVNGVEANCIPITAVADDTTDPFSKATSTETLSGATSNGLRIKTTSSTSGVINSSKIALEIGVLPRGNSINCDGDLDCENEFVFTYNLTTVVDQFGNSYPVTKSGTNNGDKNVNISSLGLANPLKCSTAIFGTIATSGGSAMYNNASSTNTSLRIVTTLDWGSGNWNDVGFVATCTKTGTDFKPITDQGVVNVGTSNSMELVVSSESVVANQTVGAGTVTVDFPDTIRARGISWNGTTNEATFLQSGKVRLSANLILYNQAAVSDWSVFPEIDTGSGFAEIADLSRTTAATTTGVPLEAFNTEFTFRVRAGNKIRLRVQSYSATSVILGDATTRYQTMSIDSVVDQQSIAASIIDNKIYDGNEYLAPETAKVGGVVKQVYRRCYEIGTAIGGTGVFLTIPSGLTPVGAHQFRTNLWNVFETNAISGNTVNDGARMQYNSSTGALSAVINSGGESFAILAGTTFCFKYYK